MLFREWNDDDADDKLSKLIYGNVICTFVHVLYVHLFVVHFITIIILDIIHCPVVYFFF
jgi:hypothetical protein